MASAETAAMSGIEIAQDALIVRYESARADAILALENVIRSAESAMDKLGQRYTVPTDFVSQYAEKYAEATAKMNAYSNALGVVAGIARQERDR